MDLNKCKRIFEIYNSGEPIRTDILTDNHPAVLRNWHMKYYGSFDESWAHAEIVLKKAISLLRENNELRFDIEFMAVPLTYIRFSPIFYSTDAYYYDILSYVDDSNYMMLFEDPGEDFPSPALSLATHLDEWVRALFLSNIKRLYQKRLILGLIINTHQVKNSCITLVVREDFYFTSKVFMLTGVISLLIIG
ncbi:hypothetical protein [Thaumasiovibrio subtropicus]|uniref:hypothetical protein n=1 Tax=Thaumasiovibrio subtropicus TaxID=1891207 RepID=UPI001C863930|nr:hypothetical protein [Thaumasiovibrio subtropicus]